MCVYRAGSQYQTEDYSIHFTLKGQSIGEIKDKIEKHLVEHPEIKLDGSTLHNCFLSREVVLSKGWNPEICDFLDSLSPNLANWSKVSDDIEKCRQLMLRNLTKVNGIAIFVGDIRDGVKEEYDLANELNVQIIVIE